MTTIGPSGRPHVRPVWGVWLDDTVQFSTGARHATNIARDPRVTVNLESGDDCVIVEGTADAVDRRDSAPRASSTRTKPKYDWPMTLDFVDVVYVVRPQHRARLDRARHRTRNRRLFQATATRWRFEQ